MSLYEDEYAFVGSEVCEERLDEMGLDMAIEEKKYFCGYE